MRKHDLLLSLLLQRLRAADADAARGFIDIDGVAGRRRDGQLQLGRRRGERRGGDGGRDAGRSPIGGRFAVGGRRRRPTPSHRLPLRFHSNRLSHDGQLVDGGRLLSEQRI